MKLARPLFAFTFAAALGYVVAGGTSGGCTPPPSTTDGGDAGADAEQCNNDPNLACSKACDCVSAGTTKRDWTCYFSVCTRLCKANADCQQHQPGAVCDDGVCTAPACGNDEQCSSSQQCSGGSCIAKVPASALDTCKVLPAYTIMRVGQPKQFFFVAYDSAGNVLPYKGAVDWGGTNGVTVAGEDGLATAANAGDATVTAAAGTADCHADVKVYANAAGAVRVLVADANTGARIQGAKVIVDGETAVETNADGVASAGNFGGSHSVHVFKGKVLDGDTVAHPGYGYVSYLNVESSDLAVLLRPKVTVDKSCWDPTVDSDPQKTGNEGAFRDAIGGTRSGWRGLRPKEFFKPLDVEGGEVHIGLFGGSIPGSLLDINLTTLIGDQEVTSIKFGQTPQNVPLPSGAVLGLSDNMFKRHYCVYAEPGVRTAWGIGGNAKFNQVIAVLGPALNDPKNINASALISGILPLFGKLQAGAVTGLQTPDPGTLDDKEIPLTTKLRLRAQVEVPQLPKLQGSFIEGAVVLAGALLRPQGTVPLGLTAGIDVPSEDDCAKDQPCHTADGYLTNPDDPASVDPQVRGKLQVRFAPLHSGLETAENAIVALALKVGALSTSDTAEGPSFAISGLVTFPGSVDYNPTNPPVVTFPRGFMGFAEAAAVNPGARSITLGAAVAGATLYRMDITNAADDAWSVYFKPPADPTTAIVLPDPHALDASLVDPLIEVDDPQDDDQNADKTDYILQAVALTGATYESILSFTGTNTDDMSKSIAAFSTTVIEPPQ